MYLRTITAIALLATTTIGGPPNAAAQEKVKKYALLVGVNRYQHSQLDTLEFAEADAADMAKLLKEKGGYEVTTLLGAEATRDRIDKELKKLAKQGSADGVVLVGFAGHGMQLEGSDEAFFVPVDAGQKVVSRDGKDVN